MFFKIGRVLVADRVIPIGPIKPGKGAYHLVKIFNHYFQYAGSVLGYLLVNKLIIIFLLLRFCILSSK